jgi:aerobic carbon-monoxide dehydrogenase large subunit
VCQVCTVRIFGTAFLSQRRAKHLAGMHERSRERSKGVGESGVVSPAAAIGNAVEDALWDRGARVTRVPLTPARVFEVLRAGSAPR